MITDDGTGDGKVDEKDAKAWAEKFSPKLYVMVIADTDGKLWKKYVEPCGSDIMCQFSCYVTPQSQIFDQGGVVVDDGCSRKGNPPSGQCVACGYDDAHTKKVLDQILPPKWCGEAIQ